MARHGDSDRAVRRLRRRRGRRSRPSPGPMFGFPVVVKADGLAAGKGVVVADDRAEAEAAVRAAMVDRQFGAAGARLVIEECLTGPEVSFFVLCGRRARGRARRPRRITSGSGDGDRGPNTGGMGAFAPSPLMTPELAADGHDARSSRRCSTGMRADGEPYRGFLYVSLMLTPTGPKVIEFNVRFGDPEAQVVLPLVEGPFARAAARRRRPATLATLRRRSARSPGRGVVLASRGYPATSGDRPRRSAGSSAAAAVPDVARVSCRHARGRRTARDRRRPRADRRRPRRDVRRARWRRAYARPSTRSSSTACSSGATSASKAVGSSRRESSEQL